LILLRIGNVSTLAGIYAVSGYVEGIGTAAKFNRVVGVAVDALRNVYVADPTNFCVRKITTTGNM
jgi:hypothetical protein